MQTCGWELQQHGEPGEELCAGEDDAVEGRYGAAGDGSVSGSSDLGVQIAVPEVVDCAACAAHDEGAGGEEEGCA